MSNQRVEYITDPLDPELVRKLRELTDVVNTAVNGLGKLHVRRKELDKEFSNIEIETERLEREFENANITINQHLQRIESKYPSGRIDLDTGTVMYLKATDENTAQS